ncbi:MAG TPA: hypothetical protein VF720_10030, partial [Candidatus Eisenbacteria bacterium]
MTACRVAVLLVLILSGVIGGPALAQPGGGQTPAPQDTLGRPVFGFLRPTYSTSYNITDQEAAWDQNFKFTNTFGLFNLESNTGYNIKTDPNRTNFKATAGTSDNRLRYNAFDVIPLSLSLIYNRDGTDDTNDRNRRSATNLGADGSYRIRLRRGMDLNLQGGAGLNARREHALGEFSETAVKEDGHDFTMGVGYGWINMMPGMSMRVDGDRTVATIKSKTLVSDTLSQPADAKTNTRGTLNGNWTYLPFEALETRFVVSRNTTAESFVLVSRDTMLNGRQEEQSTLFQSISMDVTLRRPAPVVTDELNVKVGTTTNTNDRILEKERAYDKSGNSFLVKGRKMLVGNQLDTKFEVTHDEDRSQIRPTATTDSRTLEQRLNRTVNPNLSLFASGEVSLRAQKYTDPTSDKDIQKLRAEATVNWRATDSKYTATFGGRANQTDVVAVNSAQSVSSSNEQNYGGSVNFTWRVSRKINLLQNYDYRLALTTYRFNPANDAIQRTRDIRTTLSYDFIQPRPGISPTSVRFDLAHTYRYTEFGRYRLIEGERFFARTNDRYDQDLALGLGWTVNAWLTLRTDEVFHRDDSVVRSSKDRRINRRLELLQTAKISRPLPGGGTIDASFTYRVRQLKSETQTTRNPTAV